MRNLIDEEIDGSAFRKRLQRTRGCLQAVDIALRWTLTDYPPELFSYVAVILWVQRRTCWRNLMYKLAFAAALGLLAAACATQQQTTSTAVGATAGAVVGGPVGAVVGAGAGAVAGAPGGVVDEVQGDNRPRRRVTRRQ
jgi:hypothetical protein